MKPPDLKSTLTAVVIGATIAVLINEMGTDPNKPASLTTAQSLTYGAIIGAMVQIGVRMTGVS